MDPALMFGMVSEHDEEEDETFDLSGWMSRSPPSDGLGDAPMLDDTPSFTSRPRGGGSVTSNVAASASAMGSEPSFTPRPRSNPRNMGYTYASTRENWWNPLYAHDNSKVFGITGPNNPKAIVAVKVGGIALMTGSIIWSRFRQLPNKTAFTLGALAYAHPTLGWNQGLFQEPESYAFLKNAGKALVHIGALYGGYKIIRMGK